jgi:predicted nucleic-acid-binding protein
MIGLDTHVVVCYLMQDDPVQAARANAFIEEELSAGQPGFVSLVVLVEIAWVLRACYGIGRMDVARALRALLETRQLRVERAALVVRALRRQLAANADFSDAFVIELARAHGCQEVVSFDRKARGLGMRGL